MSIRDRVREHRTQLLFAAAVLLLAALWVGVAVLRPLPPRSVTMATGPEGGAYREFGKRYREILAREGITLRLQPTAGTLDNLELLRDPRSEVSIALLQGGTASEQDSVDLASLGTVSYEPLWFFFRSALQNRGLEGLRGKRISVGPAGGASRALSLELLARNGIDESFAEWLPFPPQVAAEQLLRGEIDAALMLTSWDSPAVRRLLVDPAVDLVSFPRADAYVALYPFLSKVTVPAGVGDLARNQPPRDTTLFAPKAILAVRRDLHPAIQYLLLDAAVQIHGGPGIFQKAGQFPAAEAIDLPLSDPARQFYRTGRPFLQRYLPFWLAALLGRFAFLLLPLVGIIYPLFRLLPALYSWGMQRRIYRLSGELRFIEHALERSGAGRDVAPLAARLNQLQERTDHLRVPMACVEMLSLLRVQITLVRERLERQR